MFTKTSGWGGMLKEHKGASRLELRRAVLEGEKNQNLHNFPETSASGTMTTESSEGSGAAQPGAAAPAKDRKVKHNTDFSLNGSV